MSPFGPKRPVSETSWRRSALIAFVVMAVAFGLLLERAEDETDRVDKRVTKVESPCLKYGADSKQCEEAFSAAVSTITHPQACAIERKAGTLRAIRELADAVNVTFTEPCAGARLAQERQRGNEREATAARSNGSGGGGAPAPGGSGEGSVPGKGADSEPPAPANPGEPRHDSPPVPPNSGSEGGGGSVTQDPAGAPGGSAPTESTPAPVDSGGGSTGETPRESVLESAGATVGDVVKGTGEVLQTTTCGLAAPLLCPKP